MKNLIILMGFCSLFFSKLAYSEITKQEAQNGLEEQTPFFWKDPNFDEGSQRFWKESQAREIFPLPLFSPACFFAVLLTIIPLHNIENESYFEYYALLWSHGLSPFCSPARFLTIIVCVILKMNHILNIMLFYGLMGC